MNSAQRKILVIACFVFSPIIFLIGVESGSAFVALILPIASIFAGLFFKKSNVNDFQKRSITYEEYANALLPITIKLIAVSFVDAMFTELRKHGSLQKISEAELQKMIVSNFDVDTVRDEFVEVMRKNYTNEEFQYLANHALSPMGLKIYEKTQMISKEFEKVLAPELARVGELIDTKYDLYE